MKYILMLTLLSLTSCTYDGDPLSEVHKRSQVNGIYCYYIESPSAIKGTYCLLFGGKDDLISGDVREEL